LDEGAIDAEVFARQAAFATSCLDALIEQLDDGVMLDQAGSW